MRVEDVSTLRHDDASYTNVMFNVVLYCVSYECLRTDVYFPLHTFRFLACIYYLFHNCMFWYVYTLYSMYSPKGGNKEYLSIYLLFFLEKVSVPLINLSSVYYAKPNEMLILRSTSIASRHLNRTSRLQKVMSNLRHRSIRNLTSVPRSLLMIRENLFLGFLTRSDKNGL